MTARILKSQIGPNFELQVAAYAHDLRNWRAHMARVEQDKQNPDLPDIERHMAHPRPLAPPAVEIAVNENGDADYQIVDDGPTPGQVLVEKKRRLMQAVSIAEGLAIAGVCPLGKRRLFNIHETEILAADAEFAAGLQGSLWKRAIGAQSDITAEIEANRAPDDTAHLEDQRRRRAQTAAVERIAAQAHHDIEDLTSDTVDAWQMPAFPT